MPEFISTSAHNIVYGFCPCRFDLILCRVVFLGIVKPQCILFTSIVHIYDRRPVSGNRHILICMVKPRKTKLVGLAIRTMGMCFIGISADIRFCRDIILSGNSSSGFCRLFHIAYIAVFVIVGILQPIHRRVCGVNRAPKSFICAVFIGHGIGQSIFDTVARAACHIVPAVKHIAVSGGRVYNKGRSVAGIYRFCAIAAVHFKFNHVIIAVVVALKNGGAVGGDCLRIMIQLGKALCRLLILHRKLLVGNNRAGFGRGYAVKPHILAIHIVVDILEVIPHGIRHINCLIIDIYDILRPCIVCRNIQSNYRCVVIRIHRAALRNGDRRISRIIKRRIAEIGRRNNCIVIGSAVLYLCGKSRVYGLTGHGI